MQFSKLWAKDNFLNKNIIFLFNKEITEYDMREGGFSLIQEFKLLPDSEIKLLKEKYTKEERKIKIGKLQISNESLKEGLKRGFAEARKLFFEANELEDNDIITVKKDAIFTTRPCVKTKVGKFIEFRPKHKYSSYINLGKNLEVYYSPIDFAVKGIGDDKLVMHEDGMIKLLKMYFHKMETEEPKDVLSFMKRFADKYKRRELSVVYYRTFNARSEINLLREDSCLLNFVTDDDIEDIDISYNFYNVIIKLIKIPL